MARVFLSYSHQDDSVARGLAEALGIAGHQVWCDRQIHGGSRFATEIDRALKDAEAVVVLWSDASVESAWVQDEAAEGRDSGRLIPLTLSGRKAPLGFRQFQTIDLGNWNGCGQFPRLQELLHAIDETAGCERPAQSEVTAENKRIRSRPRRAVRLCPAIRQHERGPGAGIFQRRDHRGHYH